MFQNLRIKERLTKSFITVALITTIAAVIGLISLIVISEQYSTALVNYGFAQGDIGKATVAFADTRSDLRGVIGYTVQEVIDKMYADHDAKKARFEQEWTIVADTIASPEMQAKYDNITKKLPDYWKMDAEIMALGMTTDPVASAQAQQRAADELTPLYNEIYAQIEDMLNEKVSGGDALSATLSMLSWILVAVVVGIIAVSMFMAIRMGRNIARGISDPLKALSDRLETFAKGNLHDPFPEVTSKDEIADMVVVAGEMAETLNFVIADAGRLLNQMANSNYVIKSEDGSKYSGDFEKLLVSMRELRDQMVDTISSIEEASSQVSAGSANLADASQSLAEGASEQAGAVEELQATIATITSSIESAAQQAEDSYVQAQKYADEADHSRVEMKAMVEAMTRINETSEKIGNIISEIEDIASQTNLLSLNASIEAARAGEAGRGFAVVADQIRQLAEQSTKSAVDTRDLIEGSLQEIAEGNRAAERAAASIETVVDGIGKIAESSKNVSQVSKDQAISMEQAELGVNQISEVVQSNSATAQESSATSEELSAQAVSLDELISKFVLPTR